MCQPWWTVWGFLAPILKEKKKQNMILYVYLSKTVFHCLIMTVFKHKANWIRSVCMFDHNNQLHQRLCFVFFVRLPLMTELLMSFNTQKLYRHLPQDTVVDTSHWSFINKYTSLTEQICSHHIWQLCNLVFLIYSRFSSLWVGNENTATMWNSCHLMNKTRMFSHHSLLSCQ